jgi:transposase
MAAAPGAAGNPLRLAHRCRLAAPARRARLRLRRDVLAPPRRVAAGRGAGAATRIAVDPAASGGRDRVGAGDRRLEPGAGEKGGSATGPSPVDSGRPGSKHDLLVDQSGLPLAFARTGSNRNDVTQLIPLLDAVPAVRGLVGRPRRRPDRVIADRGYDHDRYRRLLRQRGIKPVIARRQTEHGSGLGRYRWVVERTFAWLHNFKRLLVRYERRADMHHALLGLACCLVCFRRLRSSI